MADGHVARVSFALSPLPPQTPMLFVLVCHSADRFAALAPWIGLPHRGFDLPPRVPLMPVMVGWSYRALVTCDSPLTRTRALLQGVWGTRDRTIPPGNDSDDVRAGPVRLRECCKLSVLTSYLPCAVDPVWRWLVLRYRE